MFCSFAERFGAIRLWEILFVVGFASILAPRATGQLWFGSIAVLVSQDDYLLIAADSRKLSAKGVSLHECKVDALDDELVFADTGYASYTGVRGSWDALALASRHYHQLTKLLRSDMIPALAESYGADLAAKLEPDVKAHPEEGWPQVLATALFAGFDEKRQRVVIEVKVHQVRDGGGVGYSTKRLAASDTPYAEVLGETFIAEEFAAGKTLRSQSWRNGLDFKCKG